MKMHEKKVTDEEGHVNIEVDQEVSFKVENINDSTSSEDKIDTSDELIEMDQHDCFIADCQVEARQQREQMPMPTTTTANRANNE